MIDAEVAKQDTTGWFKRTGWVEHLADSNFKHLAHASRLPDRDETELLQAARLVDTLIERGVDGLRTLHRETRRWLRSAQQTDIDVRPLARLQNPESQLRYAGYWKRFICYCLRVSKRVAEKQQQSIADRESRPSPNSDSDSEDSSYSITSGESESGAEDSSSSESARQYTDTLRDAERLFPWHSD